MGVLFQALFLVIFIGTGTVALINNFIQQKGSHLSKLEITDRDQFTNTLRKVVGNNSQCVESFRGITLPDVFALPAAITNIELLFPGPSSPGVILFGVNTGIGFQRVEALNLNIIPCTGIQCTIGPVNYTHNATLTWNLRSTIGTQRSLQGQIGPIYLTRNTTTFRPENCAFAVSGAPAPAASQAQDICDNTFGGQFNTVTMTCDYSEVFARAFLGSTLGTAPNYLQAIVTEGAKNIASIVETNGAQEGFALQNIDLSLTVNFTSNPSATCVSVSGTPIRSKWISGTTGFLGPANLTSLIPHSCSPGEQPYALFRRARLRKRGCSSNPDVFAPSNFTAIVPSISSNPGTCYRGN
jgi:hypothetical protein